MLISFAELASLFFSRNQLSHIPPFIRGLQCLEVLLIANNRLVSIPEELGQLPRLMELVSAVTHIQNIYAICVYIYAMYMYIYAICVYILFSYCFLYGVHLPRCVDSVSLPVE